MTVPKETLQHLTIYLEAKSKPRIWSTSLIELFTFAEDIEGHISRSRIFLPDLTQAKADLQKDSNCPVFQALSDELLMEIKEFLADPVNVICLSLTCREFFWKLDYQLIDIANIDSREGLAMMLNDHGSRAILSLKRAEVFERLAKDEWNELVRSEAMSLGQNDDEQDATGSKWLCGVCWKLHPGSYFSAEQIFVPSGSRTCMAATAKLRICDHWTEDYMSLQALCPAKRVDRKACEAKRLECSRTFAHTAGTTGNAAPFLHIDRDDGVKIISTYGLLRGRTGQRFAIEDVRAALQARTNIPLCQHLCLGDFTVVETYRHEHQLYALPSDGAACAVCGASWFLKRSEAATGRAPAYYADTLALVVTRHMDSSWRPWSDEYLHHVEGGDQPIERRDAAIDIPNS